MSNKPFNRAFNCAVLHLCNRVLPRGFDVSPNAPETFEGVKAHYDATGRVLVWSGASEKTIFGDPEINYAFRAWHDARHISNSFDFTLQGEKQTAMAQIADMRCLFDGKQAALFESLIYAEVIGQAEYFERNRVFPDNQAAFTLAYIANPKLALHTVF